MYIVKDIYILKNDSFDTIFRKFTYRRSSNFLVLSNIYVANCLSKHDSVKLLD